MTTEPSGPAGNGKIIGLALLGVASVAAAIGVITLVGGDGDSEAQQPPPTSQTSQGTQPSSPASTPAGTSTTAPTTSAIVTVPPITTTTPPTTAAPPATTPVEGGGPSTRQHQVRVYNNSTIPKHAAQAAEDLKAAGWDVAEVGNYPGGTIPTTTAYYRPGTGEDAAARELAAEFGMRVEERFAGIADAKPGVIVIVTNDYRAPTKN